MHHQLLQLKILFIITALTLTLTTITAARASDGVELAGDVLAITLPVAAAGVTLGHRDGTGAIQLTESAALTAGTTFLLKYTVHAPRPNGKDDHSFPSAHASASFASAEYLRKRYGWEYGLPAYLAASYVAYSRVDAHQHYALDVITGAAIGIGSSYLFTRPYDGWRVQVEYDPGYYGLRMSRVW